MLEEVAPLPFSQEEKDFQAKREDIIQNYERQAAAARIKNDAEAAAMSAQFESKNAFAAAQEALDAAVQCSQKDVVQKARNAAQAAKDAAQEALNAAGNARAHPNANNIKVALDAGAQARVASRNANFAAGEAWSVR